MATITERALAATIDHAILKPELTRADVDAELRHKLAECLWWVFVLADRLDVDLPAAYESTMDDIGAGLTRAVEGR